MKKFFVSYSYDLAVESENGSPATIRQVFGNSEISVPYIHGIGHVNTIAKTLGKQLGLDGPVMVLFFSPLDAQEKSSLIVLNDIKHLTQKTPQS